MRGGVALLLLVAATLAACGTDGFGGGSATTSTTRRVTTSTMASVPPAPDEVTLGEGVVTPAGNYVRVAELRAEGRSADVGVEACVAPQETVGVRIRADQFRLVLGDGHIVRGGSARRRPRLDETRHLRRGECTDGWVGFRMPTDAPAIAVLFVARPDADESLRWRVTS